jgi:hypothetical protein
LRLRFWFNGSFAASSIAPFQIFLKSNNALSGMKLNLQQKMNAGSQASAGNAAETSEHLENQCGNAVHSAFACAAPML